MKDGTYTLARPFNIVTNGEAADPVAVDFIAYCMSTDGQALATEEGYIGDVGADYTSTQPAGKIVVGGSSSVSPLMEKLIEAYKTVNPNATLNSRPPTPPPAFPAHWMAPTPSVWPAAS